MKKNIIRYIFAMLLLLPGSASAAEVTGGVSLQLAQERLRTLSDIVYNLHFTVPDGVQQPVKGDVEVLFKWSGGANVQLDFSGKALGSECMVNGKQCTLQWHDEHVVIPVSYLVSGSNRVQLSFTSADKALNRHADYLYTLFVPAYARSVFPCFDQPNLKARFVLKLDLPDGWTSIDSADGHPLPTYLFSFVAGKFQTATAERDGRTLRALYRETDPKKTAQMEHIFDLAAQSIKWMEDYTGVAYPFDKYGFVILPGYQFGGMEHPGAIQFIDRRMFLDESPSVDDRLAQAQLIAHETAHMWFGDLVTMDWFNDVWTKEVFANFFAAKITEPQFPDVDFEASFLKSYQTGAFATDRTDGTHPIQQQLDNLNQAGLLYGNIIYDKAPIMMRMMERLIGKEKMQQGLRAYLRKYAYGNATWDGLVALLDSVAPEAHVKDFSEVWVHQKGMPVIESHWTDGRLVVEQKDPLGRGLCWPQVFQMGLYYGKTNELKTVEVTMRQPRVEIEVDKPYAVLPNLDGSGYGRFTLDSVGQAIEFYTWQLLKKPLQRQASVMTLYENYLMHRIKPSVFLNNINTYLWHEEDAIVASSLCGYLLSAYGNLDGASKKFFENYLYNDARQHPLPAVRQKLLRGLSQTALDAAIVDSLYNIWYSHNEPLLSEQDYTNMAYHLAVMLPDKWQDILQTQRGRLKNVDEQRAFDFVSRACNPDKGVQRQLFQSLLQPENRAVEPWAAKMLRLLSCEAREPMNNDFLLPGLDALQDIQRTGDIFFPTNWLSALLSGHVSYGAKSTVKYWIQGRPTYPEKLLNKVKEQAWTLLNMR